LQKQRIEQEQKEAELARQKQLEEEAKRKEEEQAALDEEELLRREIEAAEKELQEAEERAFYAQFEGTALAGADVDIEEEMRKLQELEEMEVGYYLSTSE